MAETELTYDEVVYRLLTAAEGLVLQATSYLDIAEEATSPAERQALTEALRLVEEADAGFPEVP